MFLVHCVDVFSELSVSPLSICVQAEGYVHFLPPKGLNLNCLHCMAVPLCLEVGRHILEGGINTLKGSEMRLWWCTARPNKYIHAVIFKAISNF